MHTESYAEPGLLMGYRLEKSTPQTHESSYVIRPGRSRLVSWVNSMAQNNAPGSSQKITDDSALSQLNAQLLSATDLTVSLDGVFFEDGIFIGQNSTGYYEQIEAQVKARRDLLDGLAQTLKDPGKTDEVFSSLQRASEAEDVRIDQDSTATDFYNLYRKMFARELVGIGGAYGRKKAVAYALELRNKAWPQLKKESLR